MLDERDLIALLEAYTGGDRLAWRALIDALEEDGDPRAEAVRGERVDWDALARKLAPQNDWGHGFNDRAYFRWLIDCARYGSTTHAEVAQAVRQARRQWLQGLFPEVQLED
jgi:hypothetical protein